MYKTFCPYRICPLGAHVDHQHGLVTGFAINKGITIEFEVLSNDKVELTSDNYLGTVSFYLKDFLECKDDWGNHLRGVVKRLKESTILRYGIKGNINGGLPTGGLSSSAAISIAFIKALEIANDFRLTNDEIIDTVFWAETEFIGLKIGKLDPSCEVLCKENSLLYLDTLSNKYENFKMEKDSIPFEFLIIYSGIERKLVNSAYNVRVDECKSASYALKAFAGLNYEKYKDTYLQDVDYEVFNKYKDKLPLNWRKRAEHFYNENKRVLDGVVAWKNGDIVEFGKLVFESGRSSIELYEAGSKPLVHLFNILETTDGVYGGRFMGGGFNGCCLAIINPSKREKIIKEITHIYQKKCPEYKDTFSMHICKTFDGVGE